MLTFSPSTLQFLSVPCSSGISSLFSVQCLFITFLISPPKGISSLLSAPPHYISYQSLAKEFHSHFQPLKITFLISPLRRIFHSHFQLLNITFLIRPLQRNVILIFSPQQYISYHSLPKEFRPYFSPSTSHFLSVPRKGISFSLSGPQHYILYQPHAKEFHPYFQPLNITFLISPLQRSFILTFSP